MSNTPPFDRLTRRQRMALISILSGDEPSRTAAVAGVTARSIRNWRKLPVFQEALADARRDYFSACRSHVNASLVVAFETVLWTSGKSWSDGDRLKAALFLLDRIGHSGMSALAPSETNPTPIESTTQAKNHAERTGNQRKSTVCQRKSAAPKRNLLEPDGTNRKRTPSSG